MHERSLTYKWFSFPLNMWKIKQYKGFPTSDWIRNNQPLNYNRVYIAHPILQDCMLQIFNCEVFIFTRLYVIQRHI